MASANDMDDAKGTYSGFIGTLKWSVPVIVMTTAVIIMIIGA